MAKLKIENVRMRPSRSDSVFIEFVDALKGLKVGQSFLYDLTSRHREAISIVQHLLDRKFVSRAENSTFRVGRIA